MCMRIDQLGPLSSNSMRSVDIALAQVGSPQAKRCDVRFVNNP